MDRTLFKDASLIYLLGLIGVTSNLGLLTLLLIGLLEVGEHRLEVKLDQVIIQHLNRLLELDEVRELLNLY